MKRASFAALALLFVAPRARAEERFIVDTYDVIGGCPDEAAFHAEVERRVHARTKAPMHVNVHVNQLPRNIEGTVEVIDASGARSMRKVSSTHCSEIVSAAALVVALAIDDAAENAPAPKPEPAPAGEVTPNVAPLTVATSEASPRDTMKSDDLVLRAGAQAALQTSVAPNPVLSVPLFVELGRERRHPGFHLEPLARLSWTFAASSRGEVSAGTASFTWMSGAADLCPVRLAFVTIGNMSLADLRACGRLEVGRLLAEREGNAFSNPKTEPRLWLGLGVPVTFRLSPRSLRPLFFEIEAGPRFPLLRDRFQVGPLNSFIFRTPGAGLCGGIGAGVAFR